MSKALAKGDDTSTKSFESYDACYSDGHPIPLDGSVWNSVKVFSPDKKWCAYSKLFGSSEGIKKESGERALWWVRFILKNTSDGSERQIFETKKAATNYQGASFAIEDWTKDSRVLLFSYNEDYKTLYKFYDVSAQQLYAIESLDNFWHSCGWQDDRFILFWGDIVSYERSVNKFYTWHPPDTKLVNRKLTVREVEELTVPKKRRTITKRHGLVQAGDRGGNEKPQ